MTVGELIEFLSQFSSDAEILFCLDGEDALGSIRTFVMHPQDGDPYPMVVFEVHEQCDECGASIPADDAGMVSRAHDRSCSLNRNNKR